MSDIVAAYLRKYDRVYDPQANEHALEEKELQRMREAKLHLRLDRGVAIYPKREAEKPCDS